jgi:hypothetical protein
MADTQPTNAGSNDLVPIGPLFVPRRFTVENGDDRADMSFDVEMVDGQARVWRIVIEATHPFDMEALEAMDDDARAAIAGGRREMPVLPAEPIPPEHLATWPTLDRLLAGALQMVLEGAFTSKALWKMHEDGSYSDDAFLDAHHRAQTRAGELARRVRQRPAITRSFLESVVTLHDGSPGGVKAVLAEHDVDPRTVTRWLARAREMGLR